jgi:hypothetical protein
VEREIIGSKVKDLPASSLPPASYYQFSSPEDDGDDSDGADDSESSFESANGLTGNSSTGQVEDNPVPSTVVQRMDWTAKGNWDYSSPESESLRGGGINNIDSSEKDDDESIDLLATARQLDPFAVRAREREFDSNIAEHLAEEMPAGSSAAMADGGSGFNSPAVVREGNGMNQPVNITKTGLKRNRRSDDSVETRGGRAKKSPKIERKGEGSTSSVSS